MSQLQLSEAVDLVIRWAVDGDPRYEQGAGRLLGRLVVEGGLTLEQARTLVTGFEHLPSDPDAARIVLVSWARAAARHAKDANG